MDSMDRIIYMNTFTKSLASTIRISYMVLPSALAEKFYRLLGFYTCTVSNLEQYTLSKFISDGYFEKHINRMRTKYKLKKDRLLDAMQESGLLDTAEIHGEDFGLHFLLRITGNASAEKIRQAAAEEGIRISCLSDYYRNTPKTRGAEFVISYSQLPDDKLPEAVERLTRAVKEAKE